MTEEYSTSHPWSRAWKIPVSNPGLGTALLGDLGQRKQLVYCLLQNALSYRWKCYIEGRRDWCVDGCWGSTGHEKTCGGAGKWWKEKEGRKRLLFSGAVAPGQGPLGASVLMSLLPGLLTNQPVCSWAVFRCISLQTK